MGMSGTVGASLVGVFVYSWVEYVHHRHGGHLSWMGRRVLRSHQLHHKDPKEGGVLLRTKYLQRAPLVSLMVALLGGAAWWLVGGAAAAFFVFGLVSAYAFRTLSRFGDRDGDGYPARFVGGADCDDRRAWRNPSKTDVAGNGKDENCTGADADPAQLRYGRPCNVPGLDGVDYEAPAASFVAGERGDEIFLMPIRDARAFEDAFDRERENARMRSPERVGITPLLTTSPMTVASLPTWTSAMRRTVVASS